MAIRMNCRRIAFVYWPGPPPNSARLETMPFAINLIERLTAAGWEVDVFLWERPRLITANLLNVGQSSLPSRAKTDVVSQMGNPTSPTNRHIYDLHELSVCIRFGAGR